MMALRSNRLKVDKSTETNLLKATVAYNGAKSAVGLNPKSLTVKKERQNCSA